MGAVVGFWVFFMMLSLPLDERRADDKLRDEVGPRTRPRRGD
jgi:hypothetical protein